jgi:hypothetical protein
MPSISGGSGIGDEGEREIGDNDVVARAREGNEDEMSLLPTAGSDIGQTSVRQAKLEIPSSDRGFYRHRLIFLWF